MFWLINIGRTENLKFIQVVHFSVKDLKIIFIKSVPSVLFIIL